MACIPVSRETLRSLKALKDEEIRQEKIKHYVLGLYKATINHAETSTETFCSWTLPRVETVRRQLENKTFVNEPLPEFHRVNMPEILSRLQELFPDCTVELATMGQGQDGKMYNISKMDGKMYNISKMDEKILQFAHPSFRQNAQECIVIDWS